MRTKQVTVETSEEPDQIGPARTGPVQKLRSIEGLRGLLAMWVLFGHVLATSGFGNGWRGPFAVLADGGNAVEVFMIVSGFVIFYLLDTAREGYGRFILRRALRLYPVYLLLVVFSISLLPLEAYVYTQAPWPHPLNVARAQYAIYSLANLPLQLVAQLTMLYSIIPTWILPHAGSAILPPAWSLGIEWQFYVIAPALFWALKRGGKTSIAAIAIACAVHYLIGGYFAFPSHVPSFGMGIASYFLWRRCNPPDWPLLVPIGVALAYSLTHIPALVVWAVVFLSAVQARSPYAMLVNRVLETRLLLALGRWSYSIYLAHYLVLALSMAALLWADAAKLGEGYFFIVLLLLTVGGTLVVSALLYRFVEAPCIALGRRQRVLPAPVASTPGEKMPVAAYSPPDPAQAHRYR